jgi:hypothetical protein
MAATLSPVRALRDFAVFAAGVAVAFVVLAGGAVFVTAGALAFFAVAAALAAGLAFGGAGRPFRAGDGFGAAGALPALPIFAGLFAFAGFLAVAALPALAVFPLFLVFRSAMVSSSPKVVGEAGPDSGPGRRSVHCTGLGAQFRRRLSNRCFSVALR